MTNCPGRKTPARTCGDLSCHDNETRGARLLFWGDTMRLRAPVIFAALSLLLLSGVTSAAGLPAATRGFIEKHCIDCHDADSARAGFRIDLLTDDFAAGNNAGLWKEVMDKINSGQMPPKKKARPDPKEAFAVASWVAEKLHETELAAEGAGGRVPMRRMNRVEYANTIRDLFCLDENFARRIETELPADGKVGGFDRGAAGLFMDEGQLDQYMAVADLVLDEAVFSDPPKLTKLTWDAVREKYVHGIGVCYRDANGTIHEDNPTPLFVSQLKEPLSMITVDGFQQSGAKEKRYIPHGVFSWSVKNDGIEYLSGGSNYRRPNRRSPFFNPEWAKKIVTRDGWYTFRVQAGAFNGAGKEAQKQVQLVFEYCYGSPVEVVRSAVIDAPIDAPKEYVFHVYLRSGPQGMNRQWSLGWDNGDKDVAIVNRDYSDVQWKPIIIAGEIERATREKKPPEALAALRKQSEEAMAAALENRKSFSQPYWVYDPKLNIADRPRIWIGAMQWEGPLVDYPPKGRQNLFFAGEQREDDAYVREIFARFLPRAYRRPVSSAEVERVVAWTMKSRADRGLSFQQSIREGVKNVLCSPAFLYLGAECEPTTAGPASPSNGPQPIGGLQLASRLSYLLWSSAPDDELLQLAAADKLRDRATLSAQVKRMIADPRSAEFVRNFAGQWLGVRNFDNGNPPNRDFYRDYDDALRDSSKREPLEFFSQVLKDDLPITNFIDSKFLVINERLARHYGIDGVEGDDFRRVDVPADGRRGGVLGMAGILTYLADGTRTLPVRRATWVLDTLWNQPVPPPPPNAGNLPAIKGKPLSVRDRLQQHRRSDNCASCHARVDSFGLALENYDAVGQWRDRQNGEGLRGDKYSPALDVSGTLPDGTSFNSVQQFKAALLSQKQAFIKGFTEKLLCYALCRPIGYGDHLTVDQIVADADQHEDRLQEIIEATVASTFFQTR